MNSQLDPKWLTRILETIPEFVIVIDPAGKIRYINRLEQGFDLRDVVGADAKKFLLPGSRETHDVAMEAVLRTGQKQEHEVKLQLPDGTAWYRTEMHPLREEDRVVAVLLMATNITEVKSAEESVARLQKLLPICSWCDRIQGEDGEWRSIDAYLKKAQDTDVTHGLCPSCFERQVSEAGVEDNGTDGRGV